MKKTKRIFAFLMGAVLSMSALSGCNADKVDSSKETATPGEQTKADPYGAQFAGYPIKDENAKLKIWTTGLGYHSDYTSEKQSPYHQYLSEFTGVDIEWGRPAAGEDANQAYNLLLASGDLPDIMYIPNLPNRAETLLSEGYIIPLDKEMKQYAPALYSYLEKNPETMKAVKSDSGHLFTFPFLREDVAWQGSYVGNVVNTDMLKKVGREKPVTLQEWEDTLYALKGVSDIVFATNAMIRLKYLFANAFDIGVDNFYRDKNVVKASFVGDNYRNFLKKMNQFYKDGLIDPDFVTADTTGFSATFAASKVAVATTGSVTFGYVYDQVVKRDGAWNYDPIPYPVVKKGDAIRHIPGETPWVGTGAVITKACKNVGLAARFLDYGYTDKGVVAWNFGKEGESFNFVNGVPTLSPLVTKAAEGISNAAKRYTAMTANGISFMSLEFNKQRNLPFANLVADVCTANTEKAIEYRMPGISATEAEAKEVADLETTINTYVNEMYVNFILGSESLDNYNKYISNLESMGLSRLLKLKQQQLDRYNAR